MPPTRPATPAPSHRLLVLAVSACVAAILVVAATLQDTGTLSSSLNTGDNVTESAVDLARYRGLRASLIPRATRGTRGEVSAREAKLTSYIEALDVATAFARSAGVVAPSDTMLLVLTAAVQSDLTPEGAEILLRPWSPSSRLARVSRYVTLMSQGLPVSSAVAKAALVQ